VVLFSAIMNICFVFKDYPIFDNPKSSGIGSYIHLLSQKLSINNRVWILTQTNKNITRKQNKVTIYCTKRNAFYRIINKRIVLFTLQNLKVAWNLIRLNRRYHFDVIEFANWELEGFIFATICLFLRLPIKLICRLHTGTYDVVYYDSQISISVKIIHYLESLFLRMPNVYLSTSTYAHAKYCRKKYGLKQKIIKIIPLGIILPKQSLKKDLNMAKNNHIWVLFVGRLEVRKGITTLIKAMPLVFKKNPLCHFILIGNDYINIFNLINLYISTKYLTRVHYLGYIDSDSKLSYFYKNADLCVFPSLYESFGITIAEAMSYAKPVIATNVGGIPEIITHKKNGFLVNPSQHKSLATAINYLLSDVKFRKKLGKSAYETIKNKFFINKIYKDFEKFYSEGP